MLHQVFHRYHRADDRKEHQPSYPSWPSLFILPCLEFLGGANTGNEYDLEEHRRAD